MTDVFRNLARAGVIAVALGSSIALAQAADAFTAPPVPANLKVPAGNTLFLKAHAQGTQNYICLPSGSSFAWKFFSPQATLFFTFKLFGRDISQQIITHFLSPNPIEGGTPRRDVAKLARYKCRLGQSPGRRSFHGSGFRRSGCDSLVGAGGSWNEGRANGGKHSRAHYVRPAAEHSRRRRTCKRLQHCGKRRGFSTGDVRRRLLLLQGGSGELTWGGARAAGRR